MLKVTAAKLLDLCDLVNRKKEFLDCFGISFELTKSHGFLLVKLVFPKIFGFHQVLNLVNIPTSALMLSKVSHSGDQKLHFLFRLFF